MRLTHLSRLNLTVKPEHYLTAIEHMQEPWSVSTGLDAHFDYALRSVFNLAVRACGRIVPSDALHTPPYEVMSDAH